MYKNIKKIKFLNCQYFFQLKMDEYFEKAKLKMKYTIASYNTLRKMCIVQI